MIWDTQNMYTYDTAAGTTAEAITGDGGSTNVIDHFNDPNDATTGANTGTGSGNSGHVLVQVKTTFTGGGTLAATLQSDNDVAFGSPTDIATGPTSGANPAVGTILLDVSGVRIHERYSRILWNETGTLTVGTVEAGWVATPQAGVPTWTA